MFRSQGSLTQFNSRNMMIWFVLAFQAGAINVGGFLACHRFVTHTTGFATHFGVEAAKGDYVAAFGMLSVPLFFLFGSMISAFFVDRRLGMGFKPRYTLVMFLIFFNMFFVLIAAEFGLFGEFGKTLNIYQDYTLLSLLCLSSGIQNAAISSASGAVIRTTHLTGITTDLGIGLVRVLSYKPKSQECTNEKLFNKMRIGCIICFLFGSTLAGLIFMNISYWGFIIPTLSSFYIFMITFFDQRKKPSAAGTTSQKMS